MSSDNLSLVRQQLVNPTTPRHRHDIRSKGDEELGFSE